jgi:hypothetical protein
MVWHMQDEFDFKANFLPRRTISGKLLAQRKRNGYALEAVAYISVGVSSTNQAA